MPKAKTHSGASKRFRRTGTGKIVRQKANRRHLLEHKPTTRTRRLEGRTEVSVYFSRYGESFDWLISAGLADGRPALLVRNPADPTGPVAYLVLLDWADGRIVAIRDFRYAPSVTESLDISELEAAGD